MHIIRKHYINLFCVILTSNVYCYNKRRKQNYGNILERVDLHYTLKRRPGRKILSSDSKQFFFPERIHSAVIAIAPQSAVLGNEETKETFLSGS